MHKSRWRPSSTYHGDRTQNEGYSPSGCYKLRGCGHSHSKNETLPVRMDTSLILDLALDVVNLVTGFDLDSN